MTNTKTLLAQEQRITPAVIAWTLACTLTGLAAWATVAHAIMQQWLLLSHLITGAACTLLLTPYFLIHFLRTVGLRRTTVLISGLATLILALLFAGSGWHILLNGQTETTRWVLPLHISTAIIFLIVTVLHLVWHLKTLPAKRRESDGNKMPSLPRNTLRSTLWFNSGILVLALAAGTVHIAVQPESVQKTLPNQNTQQESESARCLSCHDGITRQWISSSHRHASSNPAYQASRNMVVQQQGSSAVTECERCHSASSEGVSCTGCHKTATANNQYLFARSTDPLFSRIHDLLIRTHPNQHRLEMGNPVHDSTSCTGCHIQPSGKSATAYTAPSHCQDCHMPLAGKVHAHHFPGGNTLLPLLHGDHLQFESVRNFLQSSKLRVTIDHPSRKDALQTLGILDEKLRNFEETPYYFYLGETARLYVVVSNRGVGHDFPGGTTGLNEAWMALLVTDAEGREIFSSGEIGDDQEVDPDAHFYRSAPAKEHHGIPAIAGESFRRTIPAGTSDIVTYDVPIPAWIKAPITVTATLRYRTLNARYAKWALANQPNHENPVVDVAWDSLNIPVRIRKEVE